MRLNKAALILEGWVILQNRCHLTLYTKLKRVVVKWMFLDTPESNSSAMPY